MGTDVVPATASGFSLDHAEALGVRVVHDRPGKVLAEWRAGGAVCAWDGETIEEVLAAVQDWHVHRLRMGAAGPLPAAA